RWSSFYKIALMQLTSPGFREGDFKRLKAAQLNALVQDLRSKNEEELGKERLQTNIFRGTPYGHTPLGTVAGLNAITLDDVKQFAKTMYTRENLAVGVNGNAPDDMLRELQTRLSILAQGSAARRAAVSGNAPSGI